MNKPKAIFCWSGGKDSAYALYKILQENQFEVIALLTTLSAAFGRVSMHGLRESMLDIQTESIGIPLIKVFVNDSTNDAYELSMALALSKAKEDGVTHVIFGDIFLDDLRQYREAQLAKLNLKCVFPLWKKETKFLIQDFLDVGFKTITCCVNDGYLDASFAGQVIDESFIHSMPENIDVCGENGEYHTFCFEGPIFKDKIEFETGPLIYKALELNPTTNISSTSEKATLGFWYCDLIPC